jgi:hypothetical protein
LLVLIWYRRGYAFLTFWCPQWQQIRVSDALLPVAHSALYVADSDLGISYHAFAALSCGLCIPMSNSSLAVSHQCDPCSPKPLHLWSADLCRLLFFIATGRTRRSSLTCWINCSQNGQTLLCWWCSGTIWAI